MVRLFIVRSVVSVFLTAVVLSQSLAQDRELLVALIEGTHEAGYAPEFVLYDDGTLLRWDYEASPHPTMVVLQLSRQKTDDLWKQLRPSESFLDLDSYYRVAEGSDYPEHRLLLKSGDSFKAVWVYGWPSDNQHSKAPEEFVKSIGLIKKILTDSSNAWRPLPLTTLPQQAVWENAFAAIREEQEMPWILSRLGWLLVTLLGLFAAAASMAEVTRRPPLLTDQDRTTPLQSRWPMAGVVVGSFLTLAGLVGMVV